MTLFFAIGISMQIMDYVHFIEQMRTPLLNQFFLFMNLFDTIYFPIVIIPLIWIACSARWAIRVICLLGLSALVNDLLKTLFALPRPCLLDPSFCLVPIQSYSFPSGGAQTAILLGGLLFFSAKSKTWKTIAILYFLLVSFSRIYLGVHYPEDILAGWVVGSAILCLYFKFGPRVEATWQ
jgi:membrane-associated phospholipid phosphatase